MYVDEKKNLDFFHHLFIHFHHNGIGSEIFLSIFLKDFPPLNYYFIILFQKGEMQTNA